jgi:hypothetical protein
VKTHLAGEPLPTATLEPTLLGHVAPARAGENIADAMHSASAHDIPRADFASEWKKVDQSIEPHPEIAPSSYPRRRHPPRPDVHAVYHHTALGF